MGPPPGIKTGRDGPKPHLRPARVGNRYIIGMRGDISG